jgi:hypothetical protein
MENQTSDRSESTLAMQMLHNPERSAHELGSVTRPARTAVESDGSRLRERCCIAPPVTTGAPAELKLQVGLCPDRSDPTCAPVQVAPVIRLRANSISKVTVCCR